MKNKKYFIYSLLLVALATIIIKSIWFWEDTVLVLTSLKTILTPFIIAIFISYIFSGLINKVDFVLRKYIKNDRTSNYLSVLIVYIFALFLILSFFMTVFPHLGKSIAELVQKLPSLLNSFINYIDNSDWINFKRIQEITKQADEFIKNALTSTLTTSFNIIKFVYNIIFGFVISIYLALDRKRLKAILLKVIKVLIKDKEKLLNFINICTESDSIFKGFIINKSLDSFIIGILCYILCIIFQLPYAGLIAILVGVTNMIPYFGPFLGGIPSALLLACIKLKYGIIFGILILCLQQFDGLWLGPKLLKKSTGMGPVSIILSISIGGKLAGPIGMFFSVPIMAVIQNLFTRNEQNIIPEK